MTAVCERVCVGRGAALPDGKRQGLSGVLEGLE
jgi:hypothetical protein